MKEVIMYDDVRRDIFKCAFAGMNFKCEPQWIVLTPRYAVEMLENYKQYEKGDQILLCEVGMPTDTLTLLDWLGGFFTTQKKNLREKIREAIDDMNRLGVILKKDRLYLSVLVNQYEYHDKILYDVSLYAGSCENTPIFLNVSYEDLNDLFSDLRYFFFIFEIELGISLEKILNLEKSLSKKVRRCDKDMFIHVELV